MEVYFEYFFLSKMFYSWFLIPLSLVNYCSAWAIFIMIKAERLLQMNNDENTSETNQPLNNEEN